MTSPTVAPTPSATTLPSPTATTLVPTATPSEQQLADQRANASFRAVTLAADRDSACSDASARSTFVSGQTIYINLCTSSHPVASTVTVLIRQTSATLCTVGPVQANASYYCNSAYTLASGRYDMLVTLRVNGVDATARDLHFTVTS